MTEAELREQYLKEMYEAEMAGTFSDTPAPQAAAPKEDTTAEAALQGVGKGMTMGYLPEIQAGAYQAGEEIANLFGANIPDESYEESLKAFYNRQKTLETDSPTASKIGEVAGAVMLPLPGAATAKGATALGRIGSAALKGAAIGGATGALQKTSDETPRLKDDPMANLKERLKNAGYGAALGGAAGSALTAVGEGIKKAAPTIGRASSGIPKNAIETYSKRADEVNAMIDAGPTSTYDVADDVTNKVKSSFFEKKKEVGQAIGQKLKESNQSIITDDLFEPLNKKLAELSQSKRAATDAGKAEIEALKEFIESNRVGLPNEIDAHTAFEIQDIFKQSGNLNNIKGGFQARYGNNASAVSKSISDASLGAYRKTNEALEKAAGTAGVKGEYAKLSKLQDKLEKYFKDPEKTFNTLSSIDAPSKVGARKTVETLENELGKNLGIKDQADLIEAYRFFQDPELLPISSGGTTSTSRTLSVQGALEAIGGLGGQKGAAFGRAVGNIAGGPMAVKKVIDVSKKVGPAMGPIKAQALRGGVQTLTPWIKMKTQEGEK